jgi:hypothetical protein
VFQMEEISGSSGVGGRVGRLRIRLHFFHRPMLRRMTNKKNEQTPPISPMETVDGGRRVTT